MRRTKKLLLISAAVLLFVLLLMLNAFAGQPFISLNSPVSFPVDI